MISWKRQQQAKVEMRAFADLYERLDSTTATNAKVLALADYFRAAPPADAAWTLYFLSGRRIKRLLSSSLLRQWTLELTGFQEWLFEESYSATGDTAECCALLLEAKVALSDGAASEDLSLTDWIETRLLPLTTMETPEQREQVIAWWRKLDRREIFILNKLLTGAFRVGVSQTLVVRGLAAATGVESSSLAHRLMGDWRPTPEWFTSLTNTQAETETPISRPYPFFLASPIETELTDLGSATDWQAERKWDGIRAQVIHRGGEVFIWSRGEELITETFPEIEQAAKSLPDGTVVDGEILAGSAGQVASFANLQKRLGRKKTSPKILKDSPAFLMAYDLLEMGGRDLRAEPMSERRSQLETLIAASSDALGLSPLVPFTTWDELAPERARSRELGVEGLMLKRRSSTYQSGRKRGDWWKWKIDPYTVDAVLIYAQAGSGRRASLFTDYTFAVWAKTEVEGEMIDELVPVAKAYSGLTDEEINKLDNWIRRHTRERFGPVRSVEPIQVFELAFEGLQLSPRHRSGVAVRFPRILRWRQDKPASEADRIETLKSMMETKNNAGKKPSANEEEVGAQASFVL